jgi:hypothetical protein
MDSDKILKQYVLDQPRFVEVTVYEDENGDIYRVFCDQDGEEWIEEGE